MQLTLDGREVPHVQVCREQARPSWWPRCRKCGQWVSRQGWAPVYGHVYCERHRG